jgi:hypothetical protein
METQQPMRDRYLAWIESRADEFKKLKVAEFGVVIREHIQFLNTMSPDDIASMVDESFGLSENAVNDYINQIKSFDDDDISSIVASINTMQPYKLLLILDYAIGTKNENIKKLAHKFVIQRFTDGDVMLGTIYDMTMTMINEENFLNVFMFFMSRSPLFKNVVLPALTQRVEKLTKQWTVHITTKCLSQLFSSVGKSDDSDDSDDSDELDDLLTECTQNEN